MIGSSPSPGQRSLVVHIGPRKTGTTSIQGALSSRRDSLRDFGVVYPGTGRQHFQAVNRLIGRRQFWEADVETELVERPWRQLLREIDDAPQGVISTEVLSQARSEHVQRIVDSAPDRTPTVIITYRLFEDLLSSTWQQLVKEGLREPLDEWSRAAVTDRPELSKAPFPRLLDLATLVDVWGGVVGPENVVIVLIDPVQPRAMFNAFEELLALPRDFLASAGDESRKRSLTAQEAELLRRTNSLLPRDSESLKRHRAFRRLVASWLDQNPPDIDDQRLSLPPDVVERARERSEEMVGSVQALSGRVRVFGDLASLLSTRPITQLDASSPSTTKSSLAAHWLAMAIQPPSNDEPDARVSSSD